MNTVRGFRLALPFVALVVAVFLSSSGRAGAQTGGGDTRQAMWNIFQSLTKAYKYALDPEAFEYFGNRDDIRSALYSLSTASDHLEKHGVELDPSFGYVQSSLATDARLALKRLDRYQFAGARFVLTRLTQNCMACHVRVENPRAFPLGEQFLEETNAKSLPPSERVSIEIAVRQFDRALATYEGLFEDEKTFPMVLNLGSTFEDYLRLCIGTRSDTERPARAFEQYIQRDDMPPSLRELIEGWIASLKKLDLEGARGKELVAARALIQDAELQRRFVSDRSRLVEFVAAETLLHRHLQKGPTDPLQIAEAFYLLAVAEANASRSYWISETPFLLERTIRGAPRSEFAKKAYSFLEEYTLAAHAGSTVPDYVQARLTELRGLVEH